MKKPSPIVLGCILIIGVCVAVVGVWMLNSIVFKIAAGLSSPRWYTHKLIEYGVKFLYFITLGMMFSMIIQTHVLPILTVMSVAIAFISYYPFVSMIPTNWTHLWVISPNLMVIPVFIILGLLKATYHGAS